VKQEYARSDGYQLLVARMECIGISS